MKIQKSIIILVLTVIFSSCSQQKSSIEPTFTFAFLTDIHIQPEREADKGLLKAIDTVNHLNPDFVITGGDLVTDAAWQTFGRADSLFNLYNNLSSNFKMPVFNTIGNHDLFGISINRNLNKNHPEFGKKMFEKRIGKRYQSFKHKGWLFLILDSVWETETGSYFGFIDSMQIEWIKLELKTINHHTPVVISTHIPFLTTKAQFDDGPLGANQKPHIINNAREVLKLFSDYNLKLVLQGHLHFLEDIHVLNKTHFITGGAVCSQWWEGKNYGMEEGFLLIKTFNNDFSWEYIDYGWDAIK